MQTPVAHREAWIVEANEGGDGHFRSRWNPAARGIARRRFDSRRERGADTGFAISVAQPANLKVRERYEFRQMISAVVESCGLDAQVERTKRQTQLTRAKVNLLSVFGRESQRDASIVKIDGERQARIVRPGRVCRICREQEGVRIGSGREIVGLISGILRVRERELGQREQAIAFVRFAKSRIQLGQYCLRITFETLAKSGSFQNLRRVIARFAGRQDVRVELAMGRLLVEPLDSDRRGAPAGKQNDDCKGDRPATDHSYTRSQKPPEVVAFQRLTSCGGRTRCISAETTRVLSAPPDYARFLPSHQPCPGLKAREFYRRPSIWATGPS